MTTCTHKHICKITLCLDQVGCAIVLASVCPFLFWSLPGVATKLLCRALLRDRWSFGPPGSIRCSEKQRMGCEQTRVERYLWSPRTGISLGEIRRSTFHSIHQLTRISGRRDCYGRQSDNASSLFHLFVIRLSKEREIHILLQELKNHSLTGATGENVDAPLLPIAPIWWRWFMAGSSVLSTR